MSWWRYRGRCTGRILHFLYHYVGFDAAEYAKIGDGNVMLNGEQIATFTWSESFGELDVPVFTFNEALDDSSQWRDAQARKRGSAIEDALPEGPTATLLRSRNRRLAARAG